MSIPYHTISEILVKEKEFVYLLGFLWADGYISKSCNSIEINVVKDDFLSISPAITKHIDWNIFHRQRRKNEKLFGKPQIKAQRSLPDLKRFLEEYNYGHKSGGSPHTILNAVPELQRYWWRGYFDGDGSIALSKNGCKNLGFWSTKTQDWTELSKLMSVLGVKFSIYYYNRKCGNSSSLTVTRSEHIKVFREFIYPQNHYDFGLKRKFDKLLLV